MKGFSFPFDRYTPGAEWHSIDGGKTWIAGPAPALIEFTDEPRLTVVKIDIGRGILTVASL